MRVLGVDPGLTRCGLGVVEGGAGRPLHAGGRRRGPHAGRRRHRGRLLAIERAIEAVAGRAPARRGRRGAGVQPAQRPHGDGHRPGQRGRHHRPPPGAGIPVALHTPSEIKAAVTGSGRADKAQVGAMVTRLLRLTAAPTPADAADALGLAICHVWRGGAQARHRRGGWRTGDGGPRR